MIRLIIILLLGISIKSSAQFTYINDQSIPVQSEGRQLNLPFGGGLNASQFNHLDLNGDDADDLVIFDKMAGKVITFIRIQNQYQYSPDYEKLFPANIRNFVLLRDYNCDGKNDLFTGDPLGIKVFTNTTAEGQTLSWKQFFFSTPSGTKQPVILTQGFSLSNLQLQFDDMPVISDVDGDGDIDILTMRYPSGSTVEYHQNMSRENFGICDSLKFVRQTQNWGNFSECDCGIFAFNNEPCNSGGRTKHSGGKSLLTLDKNGDGNTDLIFSEAECTRLYAFTNEGTSSVASFSQSTLFPADSSAFEIFPAAFYEDVDFDGIKDLLSSPNIAARELLTTNLKRSVWFYKNIGSNTSPVFEYKQNNFLQSEMIDVGDNASPVFIDIDNDQDLDLLIASFSGNLTYYKNVGNISSPSYELITDDYAAFSSLGFVNVTIQTGDLNKNGTVDLAFKATQGLTGPTKIYFIDNKSTSGFNIEGVAPQQITFTMTRNDNFHVTDVNQDGFADLLIGRSGGTLQYWKNDGNTGIPTFTLEDGEYIKTPDEWLSQYLTAATGDLNADGKSDMILSDQTGVIRLISDYKNVESRNDTFQENLVFNALSNQYESQNMGGRGWPTIVNLYNTDKPSVVIGNVLGGIRILKNDNGSSLPEKPVIELYPNPVNRTESLYIKSDRSFQVSVINPLGQLVRQTVSFNGNELHTISVAGMPSGLYFLRFSTGRTEIIKRVIVY